MQLARQIHQKGGQLAGFRGDQEYTLKQPDQLTGMNEHWIRSIQGGGTPLRQGIKASERFSGVINDSFRGCWLIAGH